MRRLLIVALAVSGSFAVLSAAAADGHGLWLDRASSGPLDCIIGRTFTVQWDAPDATDVIVDGVAREGQSGEAAIDCGAAPSGWRLWAARYGIVPQREIAASSRAADGELLETVLRVPMREPIPPPVIVSASAWPYGSTIRAGLAGDPLLRNDRVMLLIRWRNAAGGAWRGGAAYDWRGSRESPVAGVWGYVTPPGRYEIQVAYGELRDRSRALDLRIGAFGKPLPESFEWSYLSHPDQIEWSDSAFITVDDAPPRFTAETTPDSITVRLAGDLEVDDVHLALLERSRHYRDDLVHVGFFVIAADDDGAHGAVRWSGLEPATGYTLSAHHRGEEQPWLIQLLLDLRTEPAASGFEPAEGRSDRVSATAHADRIVLEWDAPAGAEDAPYTATAYRYGTQMAAAEQSDLRGARHRVILDGLHPGSAYEVVVRRERDDGMAFESRLVVETEPVAAPPTDAGIEPPQLAEPAYWPGRRDCSPGPAELSMSVVDAEGWERFEYEWSLDGRTAHWLRMRPRLDLSGIRRGRYEIRVRGLRGGAWSPWSDWTIFDRDLQTPDGPRAVREAEGVRVRWQAVSDISDDVRFILRWSIGGGAWWEERGIAEQHAVIPLDPAATGILRATVATSTPESGEGEPSERLEFQFDEASLPEPVKPVGTPGYGPLERLLPPIAIETVAATAEGIHFAWHCLDHVAAGMHRTKTRYVIRWREAGGPVWVYAPGYLGDGNPRCRYMLTNLRSGASYELGVAAYLNDWGADWRTPDPERLKWSEARTAAVPVPVEDARIIREGGRATVVWTPQPDVLRYVVVLRGEGGGRYQVVSTAGAGMASAVFDDLAEDAAYEAEVLLPPAARGPERRLEPYQWAGGPGCA